MRIGSHNSNYQIDLFSNFAPYRLLKVQHEITQTDRRTEWEDKNANTKEKCSVSAKSRGIPFFIFGNRGKRLGKCYLEGVRKSDSKLEYNYPYDLYTQMYNTDFLTKNILQVNINCIDDEIFKVNGWGGLRMCTKHTEESKCGMHWVKHTSNRLGIHACKRGKNWKPWHPIVACKTNDDTYWVDGMAKCELNIRSGDLWKCNY
eukprot:g6767.t1